MTKSDQAERDHTSDPYEIWRQLYSTNEKAWTGALEQAMGTPEFGESSGKMLEAMLAAQKSARDGMRTYLETINVPTREDIARLGELVVGLEEKIDQVADRLDSIEKAVRSQSTAGPKPVVAAAPAVSAKPSDGAR
jgi:polyhydroxyalkanoic acid synthase PhaR subunit